MIMSKIFHYNVAVALLMGSIVGGSAQLTNCIPPGIFLTDADSYIVVESPGHWRIPDAILASKIRQAGTLPESRPADQDPEDNWGIVTNGLQLALQLKSTAYTNGEPVRATMFMRNVTNEPIVYWRPTGVEMFKDGKSLGRKSAHFGPDGIALGDWASGHPEITLFQRTQHRFVISLNDYYDLSEPGDYVVRAVCHHPEVASKEVHILITK